MWSSVEAAAELSLSGSRSADKAHWQAPRFLACVPIRCVGTLALAIRRGAAVAPPRTAAGSERVARVTATEGDGCIRVAVLGTGIMGPAMARNLIRAGYATSVWDRSAAAAGPLGDASAAVTG